MSKKQLYCVYHDISQDYSLRLEEVDSRDDYCHGYIVEDVDGTMRRELNGLTIGNYADGAAALEEKWEQMYEEQTGERLVVGGFTSIGSCA